MKGQGEGPHLTRVGAEATAQALGRALAVHAAPVRLFPIRIPVGLGVVVKTAREARVVPPGVIVPLGPAGTRDRGKERGQWVGDARMTALCHPIANTMSSPPVGIVTLKRPVRPYPRESGHIPSPSSDPCLQIWRNILQVHAACSRASPRPKKRRSRLPAPVLRPVPLPTAQVGTASRAWFSFRQGLQCPLLTRIPNTTATRVTDRHDGRDAEAKL